MTQFNQHLMFENGGKRAFYNESYKNMNTEKLMYVEKRKNFYHPHHASLSEYISFMLPGWFDLTMLLSLYSYLK